MAARGVVVTDPRQPQDSQLIDQLTGLIADAQQWVARMAEEHQVATGAPECLNCPICRLIGVLRGDHPELTDRAVDLASTVVTALRTMFDPAQASSAPKTSQPSSPPAEPSRVQHIALDRPDEA